MGRQCGVRYARTTFATGKVRILTLARPTVMIAGTAGARMPGCQSVTISGSISIRSSVAARSTTITPMAVAGGSLLNFLTLDARTPPACNDDGVNDGDCQRALTVRTSPACPSAD